MAHNTPALFFHFCELNTPQIPEIFFLKTFFVLLLLCCNNTVPPSLYGCDFWHPPCAYVLGQACIPAGCFFLWGTQAG
jgi:hypothetical protein